MLPWCIPDPLLWPPIVSRRALVISLCSVQKTTVSNMKVCETAQDTAARPTCPSRLRCRARWLQHRGDRSAIHDRATRAVCNTGRVSETPPDSPPNAAPGWFPAVDRPEQLRYWNGQAWTDDYTQLPPPQHNPPRPTSTFRERWASFPLLVRVAILVAFAVVALVALGSISDSGSGSERSSYEDKMAAISTDQFCLSYEEMQAAGGYALMREQVTDAYAKRSGLSDDDVRFVMVEAIERCADKGFEVGP